VHDPEGSTTLWGQYSTIKIFDGEFTHVTHNNPFFLPVDVYIVTEPCIVDFTHPDRLAARDTAPVPAGHRATPGRHLFCTCTFAGNLFPATGTPPTPGPDP